MEWKFSKNEKVNKVILVVLLGIMLLVIVMPMKPTNKDDLGQLKVAGQQVGKKENDSCEDTMSSYETKLTSMLERTYGMGTVQVMIYGEDSASQSYYGADNTANKITGVLIVIAENVMNENTISDITMAVCALFNLPAHKVAVLVKR